MKKKPALAPGVSSDAVRKMLATGPLSPLQMKHKQGWTQGTIDHVMSVLQGTGEIVRSHKDVIDRPGGPAGVKSRVQMWRLTTPEERKEAATAATTVEPYENVTMVSNAPLVDELIVLQTRITELETRKAQVIAELKRPASARRRG